MKKVLIIIPYQRIYPPVNGGMQRCFNLLRQIAKYFELTIIIDQPVVEFLEASVIYPELSKVKVLSTHGLKESADFFSIFPKRIQPSLRFRWLARSLKGPADGHFLKYYTVLNTLLNENEYDFVVLFNLSTLNAVKVIRKMNKKARIVYDAQNVDTNLLLKDFNNKMLKPAVFYATRKAESTLYKKVNGLMVCSNEDLASFSKLNKGLIKSEVVPNGIEFFSTLTEQAVQANDPRYIIFCGSLNYDPNIEGLSWFYSSIWPMIRMAKPNLKLLVVGSGNPSNVLDGLKNDQTVEFVGAVPDVKEYYNKAAIAIVPLKTGSGTRLKILESMSLGVPVVSTSTGAEGILYTADKDILIADDERLFADHVISLLNSKEKRLSLQSNARFLIKELYDWDVVGKRIPAFFNSMA